MLARKRSPSQRPSRMLAITRLPKGPLSTLYRSPRRLTRWPAERVRCCHRMASQTPLRGMTPTTDQTSFDATQGGAPPAHLEGRTGHEQLRPCLRPPGRRTLTRSGICSDPRPVGAACPSRRPTTSERRPRVSGWPVQGTQKVRGRASRWLHGSISRSTTPTGFFEPQTTATRTGVNNLRGPRHRVPTGRQSDGALRRVGSERDRPNCLPVVRTGWNYAVRAVPATKSSDPQQRLLTKTFPVTRDRGGPRARRAPRRSLFDWTAGREAGQREPDTARQVEEQRESSPGLCSRSRHIIGPVSEMCPSRDGHRSLHRGTCAAWTSRRLAPSKSREPAGAHEMTPKPSCTVCTVRGDGTSWSRVSGRDRGLRVLQLLLGLRLAQRFWRESPIAAVVNGGIGRCRALRAAP